MKWLPSGGQSFLSLRSEATSWVRGLWGWKSSFGVLRTTRELSVSPRNLPPAVVPWEEDAVLPVFPAFSGIQGMQPHTQASGQAGLEEGRQSGLGAMCWGHQGSLTFCSFLLTELAFLPPVTSGEPCCRHLAQGTVGWPRQGTPGTEAFPEEPSMLSFPLTVCSPLNADHGALSLRPRDCPLTPVNRREEGRHCTSFPRPHVHVRWLKPGRADVLHAEAQNSVSIPHPGSCSRGQAF